MFDFIDRLRGKPEEYRVRFVILSSAVVTGIILFTYVSIQLIRIDNSSNIVAEEKVKSPFSSIQSAATGFLKEGKSKIDELRGMAKPILEQQ